MAEKMKNRILAYALTMVMVFSLAGSLYFGSGRIDEAYGDLKYFFVSADTDVVFYNEATRTTINYEVEDKAEDEKDPADNVTKEDFDKINDAYVSEFFLDFLSPQEQKVYHQLYKGIYDFQETIAIENDVLKQDDVGDFIVLFTSSNPYVNYIGGSYTISLNKKGYVTAVNVEYSMTKEQAKTQRAVLDKRIEDILSGMAWTMSQYDKVKYLHDYIVQNCTYDDKANQPYSAYGCLVEGRCVCEGYAKAMLALCDRAGINAIPVIGQAGETGEGQGHIWNKVMIDEKWYDFDVTWDDPVCDIGNSYVRYDYFGINDEQFERNHTPDKNRYMNYPDATSDKADYFVVNELICDDGRTADETMKKAVDLSIRRNESFARIKCTDKDAYIHACDKLFDSDDGTTEMFRLLNELYSETGKNTAASYSIIKNDEVYTITVRFTR